MYAHAAVRQRLARDYLVEQNGTQDPVIESHCRGGGERGILKPFYTAN